MLEFTDGNFNEEVLFSDGLVLVDFWASWCRPCQALTPLLESVANDNPSVKFGKLNIDDNPETAGKYNISAIPTILFFKGGSVVERLVGMQKEQVLREAVANNA